MQAKRRSSYATAAVLVLYRTRSVRTVQALLTVLVAVLVVVLDWSWTSPIHDTTSVPKVLMLCHVLAGVATCLAGVCG